VVGGGWWVVGGGWWVGWWVGHAHRSEFVGSDATQCREAPYAMCPRRLIDLSRITVSEHVHYDASRCDLLCDTVLYVHTRMSHVRTRLKSAQKKSNETNKNKHYDDRMMCDVCFMQSHPVPLVPSLKAVSTTHCHGFRQ
jgi:hypothetical protein